MTLSKPAISARIVLMDGIDREILSLLQANGRATVTEIAHTVGLSMSACHRRIKELESSGAILGYRAVIAAEAVDLQFEAVVFVRMTSSAPAVLTEFEAAVLDLPGIVSGHRLFGDPDYMLRILTKDLNAFQNLYDTRLGSLPGVQRLTSTIVMKRVGIDGNVPI